MVQSTGCYHDFETEILIVKSKKNTIIHYNGKTSRSSDIYDLEKIITRNELRQIKRIFTRGIKIKKGGCTSRDHFKAEANDLQIRFVDGRCSKNDLFDRLNRELKIK